MQSDHEYILEIIPYIRIRQRILRILDSGFEYFSRKTWQAYLSWKANILHILILSNV